jgi:hypothetical protein
MQVVEVNTPLLDKSFCQVNADLNKTNPHYIRPLDNEVLQVFDPSKNKLFKEGNAKRWLLKNEEGKWIGRIAAFYYPKYKNKGTEYPTGCVGFFE